MNGDKNYKTKIAGTLLGLTMAVTLGATPAYARQINDSGGGAAYQVDNSGSMQMLKKIRTDGVNSGDNFKPKPIPAVQWSSDAGSQIQMKFKGEALKQAFPDIAEKKFNRKEMVNNTADVIESIDEATVKVKLELGRVMDGETLNKKQYQEISIGSADPVTSSQLGSFCGYDNTYGALVYKVNSFDEVNKFNAKTGKYTKSTGTIDSPSCYYGGKEDIYNLKDDNEYISPSELSNQWVESSSPAPKTIKAKCIGKTKSSINEEYAKIFSGGKSVPSANTIKGKADKTLKNTYLNMDTPLQPLVASGDNNPPSFMKGDYNGHTDVDKRFTAEPTSTLVAAVCATPPNKISNKLDLDCPESVDIRVGDKVKTVSLWDELDGRDKYNGSQWTPQACYHAKQKLENATGGANGIFTPALKELLGDDYLKNHTSYDINASVKYRNVKCDGSYPSGYHIVLGEANTSMTEDVKDMLCNNGSDKRVDLATLKCTAKTNSSNDKNSGSGNYCLQDADWGDTEKESNDKPDLDEKGAPAAQGAGSAKQGEKSVSDPLNFPRLGGETMQGADGKTHTVPGNSEGNGAISKTAPGTKPAPKGNGLTNDTFVSKAKDQKAYSAAKAEKQKETAKADANKKQGELRSVPEDANLPGEFLPSYTCDTDNLNGINGTQAFTAGIVRGQSGDLTLTTPKPRAINGYELKDVKLLEMNLLRDSESTPWEPTTDFANQPLSEKALTIGYGDEKQILTGKGQATNWYYTDKDTNTFTIKGMDASKDGKPTIIQPQYRYTAQILTPQRVLTNMSIRNGQIIPTYEWRKIWTPTTLACRAPAINLGVLTTGANGANGGGEKPLTNTELKSKPTENGYSYYGENTWGKNKGEISENGKH